MVGSAASSAILAPQWASAASARSRSPSPLLRPDQKAEGPPFGAPRVVERTVQVTGGSLGAAEGRLVVDRVEHVLGEDLVCLVVGIPQGPADVRLAGRVAKDVRQLAPHDNEAEAGIQVIDKLKNGTLTTEMLKRSMDKGAGNGDRMQADKGTGKARWSKLDLTALIAQSVLTTARRRDTSRSSCRESRFRSISV